MFKKKTAFTVYFSGTRQEKMEIDGKPMIVSNNQMVHFEMGAMVNGDEGLKVIKIKEGVFRKWVSVEFANGVCWKYTGFDYIIS